MKKTKKLLAMIMTMSMILGTACMASAETNNGSAGTDVTGSGSTEAAIIDVEIPTTFTFKVDPFNTEGTGSSVTTTAMTIENKSNVPVEIQMTKLKGTSTGTNAATFATAPLTDSTDKNVFLWVGPVVPTFDKSSGDIASVKQSAYTEKTYSKNIVSATESQETISLGTLLQATYESGSYKETNAKGKMYIGINGAANSNSEKAWESADSIEVTATFNVVPKVVGSVK